MTLTSIYQRLEKKKKSDRESEFSCTPPPPQSTVSSLCIPFGEGKGRLAGEIFRTVHYKIVISNWIVFLSSKEKKPCAKDIPGGISTYWNTRHWTVFVFVPAFINFTRILYTGSPLRKRIRRRLNADNNSTRDHPAYDFGALIIIKLIFIKRQVPGGSSCALCAITIQYRRFDIIRPMKIIEKKKISKLRGGKYHNFTTWRDSGLYRYPNTRKSQNADTECIVLFNCVFVFSSYRICTRPPVPDVFVAIN